MSSTDRMRLAIVGCGAVAGAHLPIIADSARATASALVDKSRERAAALARDNNLSSATILEDFNQVPEHADAAIVALPHHLHASASIALLERGVHVLVEKPMALTTAECDAMIAAAEKSGAVLAVGHLRRFFHSSRFVKRAIECELLGPIVSFDAREGSIYNWPAASDFTFRRDSGGGVLSDQGAHTMDTLLWWLGDYESIDYRDDAEGGVDADCEIRLRLKSGATGIVELSRTRDLRGTVILHGERGSLEIESKFDSAVQLHLPDEAVYLDGRTLRRDDPGEDVNDIFRRQLGEFLDAIRERRDPLVSGREARRAVACLEACRAVRQPLELSWRA